MTVTVVEIVGMVVAKMAVAVTMVLKTTGGGRDCECHDSGMWQ